MINFTSMATGFQNRGDENRVERRKVAEAFEQFKQNNPEATLAQFQQYIDGMSGGRNYLAGGAGSGETLRKLASDNQAKKARRLAAEAQASLLKQYKTSQRVEEDMRKEIENSLLSAKPTKPKEGPEGRLSGVQPKINYGRLAREFAEKNPLIGKMGVDLSDMFTAQTRTDALNTQTTVNLPVVQALINGMPSEQLKNLTSDDLTTMYPMAPLVADAVLNKAKGVLAEQTELKVQDLRQKAGDHLRTLFSSGLLDETSNLEDAVRDRFMRDPNYAAAFLDPDGTMDVKMSNFTNSMQRSLTSIGAERNEKKALERGTRRSTVMANIRTILNGEEGRIKNNLVRPQGFDLEKKRLLPLLQGIITDEFRDELLGGVVTDQTHAGMPSIGDLDAVLESFLQGLAQERVSNHQTATAQAREEARIVAPKAGIAAIAANVKVGMDTYAGDGTQGAAQSGGNELAGQVMQILGQKYVMDPVTLGVIGKMLPTFVGDDGVKAGDDGMRMSAAEMANEIEVALGKTNGVQGTAGLVARAEQIARAKLIGPDSLTFSQYEERMTKSIDESETNVLELAQDAYSAGLNGDPTAIDGLKRLLKRHTTETIPYYKSLTEAHRGTSKIWINNADERNSHWDQRRVDAMLGSLEGGTAMQTINKMIEEISRNAAEQSRTMPSVQAPVVAEPPAGLVSPPVYSDSGAYIEALKSDDNAQVAVDELQTVVSQDVGAAVEDFKQMGETRRDSDTFGGVEKIRSMVAKAEADGYAPPYSSMSDDFERRDWREAFGRTHDELGKRIPTIGEKLNSGVQDVKGLLGFGTAGDELAQQQNNFINQARIDSGVTELDKFYLEAGILEPELRTKELLKELYANEKLNIDKPANRKQAQEVVEIVREIFGNRARLNEAVDGLTREIMTPFQ